MNAFLLISYNHFYFDYKYIMKIKFYFLRYFFQSCKLYTKSRRKFILSDQYADVRAMMLDFQSL